MWAIVCDSDIPKRRSKAARRAARRLSAGLCPRRSSRPAAAGTANGLWWAGSSAAALAVASSSPIGALANVSNLGCILYAHVLKIRFARPDGITTVEEQCSVTSVAFKIFSL